MNYVLVHSILFIFQFLTVVKLSSLQMTDFLDDSSISELPSSPIDRLQTTDERLQTSSICVVCGHGKATVHYGAITCGSCKIFFFRAIMTQAVYMCEKKKSCDYPNVKCRACRFQKCVTMGMMAKAVGKKEGAMKRFPIVEEIPCTVVKVSAVPYFTNHQLSPSSRFVNTLRTFQNPAMIASELTHLERFCDAEDLESLIDPSFKFSLDMCLEEAIQNPLSICDRTPILFGGNMVLPSDPTTVTKALYCRHNLHYIDFLRASHELWTMSDSDRLRFSRRQVSCIITLTMFYNTYKYSSESCLYGHGIEYEMPKGTPEEWQAFSMHFVRFAQKHIISVFRKVKLTPEEFGFLKMILLFTAPPNLSDKGNEIVRNARKKYEFAFAQYLAEMNSSSRTNASRLTQIMGVIPFMLKLAVMDDAYFGRMTAFNIENLAGKFSIDVHLTDD